MFCKNLKFGIFLGGRDFDTRQLLKHFKAGLGMVLCLLQTLQVTDWVMGKYFDLLNVKGQKLKLLIFCLFLLNTISFSHRKVSKVSTICIEINQACLYKKNYQK
jgi:hypothetical protein